MARVVVELEPRERLCALEEMYGYDDFADISLRNPRLQTTVRRQDNVLPWLVSQGELLDDFQSDPPLWWPQRQR